MKADEIVDLYERHARAFDRDRGRTLFEKAWLDRFLDITPPPKAILDMGCGGGEPITRYLIQCGAACTGVDSSASMIEICTARFPQAEFIVADMRTLDLRRRFDGLLAWDSFFHLAPDDQRRMFSVFRRHAAPNAAVMFTSGPREGVAIGEYRGEPLYHASLDPAEYRTLFAANGFDPVAYAPEDPACGGHTVWLSRRTP